MANLNLSEIQEQLKITTEHINQLKSLIITLQTNSPSPKQKSPSPKQKSPSPKQKSPSLDYIYQIGEYDLTEYVNELRSVLSKDDVNRICETINKINELKSHHKDIIIDNLNTKELEKYLIIENICKLRIYGIKMIPRELQLIYILKKKLKEKENLLSLDINQLKKLIAVYHYITIDYKPIVFETKEIEFLNVASKYVDLQTRKERLLALQEKSPPKPSDPYTEYVKRNIAEKHNNPSAYMGLRPEKNILNDIKVILSIFKINMNSEIYLVYHEPEYSLQDNYPKIEQLKTKLSVYAPSPKALEEGLTKEENILLSKMEETYKKYKNENLFKDKKFDD